MKILIAGGKGQLGSELQTVLKSGRAEVGEIAEEIRNAEVEVFGADEFDITKLINVREVLTRLRPNVVINCAAFTNVDECESNEELAFRVNSIGPRNLAIVCKEIGAKLVQVSTDYVFSGGGHRPLAEYDLTTPISVYGKTKLLGEKYVQQFCDKYFIVRTAWLYGHAGNNFVYKIIRLGKEKDSINVVNDQMGNPTNANDLVYHILKLIQTEEYGIYHCTGNGECTWYDFAKIIIKLSGSKCEVKPCTSEEYKTLAKRPEYSSMKNMALKNTIGDEMREWSEAIKSFINNLNI